MVAFFKDHLATFVWIGDSTYKDNTYSNSPHLLQILSALEKGSLFIISILHSSLAQNSIRPLSGMLTVGFENR